MHLEVAFQRVKEVDYIHPKDDIYLCTVAGPRERSSVDGVTEELSTVGINKQVSLLILRTLEAMAGASSGSSDRMSRNTGEISYVRSDFGCLARTALVANPAPGPSSMTVLPAGHTSRDRHGEGVMTS